MSPARAPNPRAERRKSAAGLPKADFAVLDQALISGSNFIMGILLARWMVPDEYGAYSLAFSVFCC